MAKAISKKAAAQKAGAKAGAQTQIDALFVRARTGTLRRAGHRFDTNGHGIALDLLTEQQIADLKNDQGLIVDECTIEADAIAAASTDTADSDAKAKADADAQAKADADAQAKADANAGTGADTVTGAGFGEHEGN